MQIDPTKTQIDFDFTAREVPELLQNLQTLFTTPAGTVPLDRDFGIDFSILDKPMLEAQNKYTAELMKKVNQYEPRVKIKNITYQHEAQQGILMPKVVISLA